MVKTRRKSKAAAAAAAAAAAEHDYDGVSTQGTEDISVSAQLFTVPIPVDIDLGALSNIIPEVSFTNPTPDTIVSVYRLLLAQVAENDEVQQMLEEAQAEVDRKEIELDQAVQDGETKSKDLEHSFQAVQSQLNTVRAEREQLTISKNELEARVASLNSSRNTSSTELDQLRYRLDECEKEKRDLIVAMSRSKEDATQCEEEIKTLRSSLRQAREEHGTLKSQFLELNSTESSNQFKLVTLTQQLTLAQDETARVTAELSAKTEEYAHLRRTKHAEFTQLQAAHDTLAQKHASMESSFKAMQAAHEMQARQYQQASARVQDLQGRLTEQEIAFSTEVSGLKRLVTIMEEREKQGKEIVEGIEREWAEVGERAEKREAVLRDEAEKERRAREEVERRMQHLETVLERMSPGELPVAGRGAPLDTPIRNQDAMAGAMLGLSPTVAMVSKLQKGGRTFTDVYADLVRLEEDYASKCAEYDRMERTLSDVLAQIEERAPILAQQHKEYERLEVEAIQLSTQLSTAVTERDANADSLQEVSQKFKKSQDENGLLQHQLTDLGRQVQTLLKELGRRDDPSIVSDDVLDEMEPLPPNNIETVITNNLVLFRSISGMQEQNQKLLKIVREMGAKMESEERDYRVTLEQEQSEAVREAHEAIQDLAAQLERQKKSSEITIQAYIKERDILKAMLAPSERTAPHFGINGAPSETTLTSNDLATELADTQAQWESYKQEMGLDTSKLHEDLQRVHQELGKAKAALASASAQNESLKERYHSVKEQLALKTQDSAHWESHCQHLRDQQTRIEIDRERVADELAMSKIDLERHRNEAVNLRAEKKIWEAGQNRLVEENKTLSVERGKLADIIANVQRLYGDLEQSEENHRKRLEMQVRMMEDQIQNLKSQLSQHRETIRHITLQKELDTKDLQARLDKTTEQLAVARESLIGAERSKIDIEKRIEELTSRLQGNEEKLAVYERRTSTTGATSIAATSGLSHEQQLEQEVAEARSALRIVQIDLTSARSHMQQFQDISQANEAALAALNSTHDQYKADAEVRLSRQESEYRSLGDKLHSVEEELQQTKARINEIQQALETERSAWASEKQTLEGTIFDLSTSERLSEHDRGAHQKDVRELEERTITAEANYRREVVAHAESVKSIENLKQQLSTAQDTARQNLADAAAAQAKLEATGGSWKQQKDALEKEVSDLGARCKDLTAQNTLLYNHLDTVSSQAARIRQAADSSMDKVPDEADASGDVDTQLSDLRAVIPHLRKEKEIIDLQLELCKQENVRLKSQIGHLHQTLEETRRNLSEVQERAMQAAASDAQHAELLERINQNNILRESNATLRAECKKYSERARSLDSELKTLSAQLEPAKEEVRVVRAELQARDSQIALLSGESKHWQERNAQLLTKYDRIDPAEVQNLKTQIETRNAKIESLNTSLDDVRKKTREQLNSMNRSRSELNEKNNTLTESVKKLSEERDALRDSANARASTITSQLESLRQEKAALEKALADEKEKSSMQPAPSADHATLIASLQAERDKLKAEKEDLIKSHPEDADSLKTQWDAEKAKLQGQISKLHEVLSQMKKKAGEDIKKANDELRNLKQANEKLQARMNDMQTKERSSTEHAAESGAPDPGAVPPSEQLMKLHAKELEDLQARLTTEHVTKLEAVVGAAIADCQQKLAAELEAEREKVKALEGEIAEMKARQAAQQKTIRRLQEEAKKLKAPINASTNAPAAPATTMAQQTPPVSAPPPATTATSSTAAPPISRPAPAPPQRGTGFARGGLAIRGSSRPPMSGAAPGAQPRPIQIMGAASKRGREADTPPDDSLAKRIKPAAESESSSSAPEAGGSKPPITLKRPQL